MYAVIKTGGKQYKVSEGQEIYIEKLDVAEGSEVEFEIVAGHDGKKFYVGNPLLTKAKVSGKVLKNGKAKKITVFTYKPKKGCKRKLGHRQIYTKVQIEKISF